MDNSKKVKIVILAAGHGKRMGSDLPKVLIPLSRKPLISYVLDSVKESGVCDKPLIVIGQQRELIKQTLGNSYEYAIQEEQLGTGHAVLSAMPVLKNKSENIMVLYGDHPFVSSKTIKKLTREHIDSGAKITFATAEIPDFFDWRRAFINFGRIIRYKEQIEGIKEYIDATKEEKGILEINPAYYVFNTEWLSENMKKIENNNKQKEYYLTDLLRMAVKQKEKIKSIKINPKEALGANSREELDILEKFVV